MRCLRAWDTRAGALRCCPSGDPGTFSGRRWTSMHRLLALMLLGPWCGVVWCGVVRCGVSSMGSDKPQLFSTVSFASSPPGNTRSAIASFFCFRQKSHSLGARPTGFIAWLRFEPRRSSSCFRTVSSIRLNRTQSPSPSTPDRPNVPPPHHLLPQRIHRLRLLRRRPGPVRVRRGIPRVHRPYAAGPRAGIRRRG